MNKVAQREPGQQPADRRVSHATFAEPACDHVAQLVEYDSPAGPGDVRSVSGAPLYVVRLIEVFARLPERRRSLDVTAAYCIGQGIALLAGLPGVETIRAARESAQAVGDGWSSAWFENWPYDVDAHGSGKRVLRVRVCGENWALCGRLAEDLGLHRSTVAALSTMAVLVQVPFPVRQHDYMVGELRRYRCELQERAERARELAANLPPKSPARARAWGEVLGDD